MVFFLPAVFSLPLSLFLIFFLFSYLIFLILDNPNFKKKKSNIILNKIVHSPYPPLHTFLFNLQFGDGKKIFKIFSFYQQSKRKMKN